MLALMTLVLVYFYNRNRYTATNCLLFYFCVSMCIDFIMIAIINITRLGIQKICSVLNYFFHSEFYHGILVLIVMYLY